MSQFRENLRTDGRTDGRMNRPILYTLPAEAGGPITHFLIHCAIHHCAWKTLFQKTYLSNDNISEQCDSTITKVLLFGDNKLDFETNKILKMSAIGFILPTERFSLP